MIEKGKIVNQGMGGFLNPPTHPEHDWSVESIRKGASDFSMCLSSAIDCQFLDSDTKKKAKELLKSWKRPALKDQRIQDWICQVMGYFKNCYQGENGSWTAGDLKIDSKIDPISNQNIHAGVHFIRKFYPQFKLKEKHIKEAYWGEKSKK